jgi:glucose/arabinose dehydrogenase
MSRPFLFLLTALAAAQPLYTTRVGDGFNQPTFATAAPGDPGTLYVLEKTGAVRALDTATGAVAEAPFLNLNTVPGATFLSAGSEQGLLGLAFHPDFRSDGYFYVDYTAGTGNGAVRVDRFTYDFATHAVDVNSRQSLLDIPSPFGAHNAGWLGFSPTDGYLYVTVGDGGGAYDPLGNAQNRAVLNGKVLRLDVNATSPGRNYAIPASNPFVNDPDPTVRREIWAYGLRNPWRASFDRLNGNFYIADVGQADREEINFQAAGRPGGANYGWRNFEGSLFWGPTVPPNYVPPIYEYSHNGAPASVTGGYVYHGDLVDDDGTPLDGTYFFADYVGSIWSFRYDGEKVSDFKQREYLRYAVNGGVVYNFGSFAEDGYGNLYVVDVGGGGVYRIEGVPEPGALALGGVAALALWLRHRRRPAPPAV